MNVNELLTRIRQSPEAKRGYQVLSWFIIIGGMAMLIVGLTTSAHPNPYLLSTLIVIGIESVVTGVAMLLLLHQSRKALWVMLLSCVLFAVVVCLLVQVFTYSP